MCESSGNDALLQLELELYRGQAQVLAKRVCELELRRQGLPDGNGTVHESLEGCSVRPREVVEAYIM